MSSQTGNVYEFRNAPLGNPGLRERVVWIIFGGGGVLMMGIAAVVALTSEEGVGEGLKKVLVYLILGLVIAILPFGLRHGIRSQNARRGAFSIEITEDGLLRISLLEKSIETNELGLRTREFPLQEVADIRFVKSVQSFDAGATRNRSVDYYITISRRDREDEQILIPPNAMGQATGLPEDEKQKLLAAARPFVTGT